MNAVILLNDLRASGVVVTASDGKLAIEAPAPLPDATLSVIRSHKAELLALLAANDPTPDQETEARRLKVLAMLEADPTKARAFLVDDATTDPVIVVVAIRDVGTCELLIPLDRYDPFKMLALIEAGENHPKH